MSDNTTADTPLSKAHYHLDILADHLGLDAMQRQELRARHDIQVRVEGDRLYYVDAHNHIRLDASRGYADLSTGPWVAAMQAEHPDMFPGKVTRPSPETAAPAAEKPVIRTGLDMMNAVRDGRMSATEAVAAHLAAQAPTASHWTSTARPAKTGSMTDLMARAKSGDAEALATLRSGFGF